MKYLMSQTALRFHWRFEKSGFYFPLRLDNLALEKTEKKGKLFLLNFKETQWKRHWLVISLQYFFSNDINTSLLIRQVLGKVDRTVSGGKCRKFAFSAARDDCAQGTQTESKTIIGIN